MALGFIKKIFSFSKEEKPATPVEEAKSGALADDGLPEATETLIVPDHLDREDEENVASELKAQADSIAAFEETIEEETATTPEDSNEPIAIQEPFDDSDLPLTSDQPARSHPHSSSAMPRARDNVSLELRAPR